jgi:hypothetical protein
MDAHEDAQRVFDDLVVSMRLGSDPDLRGGHARAPQRVEATPRAAWPQCHLPRTARAVAQLVDVLEYLHARGIVHRDLKPENIMVDGAGVLKLVDFGIAKNAADVGKLSITGGPMGTPAYIAPESAAGQSVSAAADLYSLGCILFEIFAGRCPFEGSPLELLWMHQHAEVPKLSDFVVGAPPHLEQLCRSLMVKDPSKRPSLSKVREILHFSTEGEAQAFALAQDPAYPVVHQDDLERVFVRLLRSEMSKRQLLLLEATPRQCFEHLVIEVLRQAEERGFRIFRSHCLQSEDLPFRAFDPFFDDLALSICRWPDVSLARLAGPLRAVARAFASFHVIFERRWDIFGPPAMVDLSSRPMQARTPQSISDAVHALGEVLHEQSLLQPTVVALHDFHNADKESIELLRALIDRTERSRLALIGVYASRELAMRPVLRRFLHDLAGREDALRIQGA